MAFKTVLGKYLPTGSTPMAGYHCLASYNKTQCGVHILGMYDAHAAYLPGGGLSRGSRPAGRAEDGGRRVQQVTGGWAVAGRRGDQMR